MTAVPFQNIPLRVVVLLLLSTYLVALHTQISNKLCNDNSPTDILLLLDTLVSDPQRFKEVQSKLLETLRFINSTSSQEGVRYGLITYGQNPHTDLLLSPHSIYNEQLRVHIVGLQPLNASKGSVGYPARALRYAADMLANHGRKNVKRIVIMAFDGMSADLIAESLDARNELEKLSVNVFAIIPSQRPNALAVVGYTGNRRNIYFAKNDKNDFFSELNSVFNKCIVVDGNHSGRFRGPLMFGVRSRTVSPESASYSPLNSCSSDKVDLIMVLDTSGSVFNAFAEERDLVEKIIESIGSDAFIDGRLQVSLVSFSSDAKIILPFKIHRSKDEVLLALHSIKFTGLTTRISNAVKLGLEELERARRKDATQVFILITDGHGQEFWQEAVESGQYLQVSRADLYAVTTSRDYNLPELILYVGDKSKTFVGQNAAKIVSSISPKITRCLSVGRNSSVQENMNSLGKNIYSSRLPFEFSSVDLSSHLHFVSPTTQSIMSESHVNRNRLPFNELKGIHDILRGNQQWSSDVRGAISNLRSSESDKTLPFLRSVAKILDRPKAAASAPKLVNNGVLGISQKSICPDQVYLVVLLDETLSPYSGSFKTAKRVVKELIEMIPNDWFGSLIHVSIIKFNDIAKIVVKFDSHQSRNDILAALARTDSSVGVTKSIAAGIHAAVDEFDKIQNEDTRKILVLFSNAMSDDPLSVMDSTANRLRKTDVHSYSVAIDNVYHADELITYAGSAAHLFSLAKGERQKFLALVGMNMCLSNELITNAVPVSQVEVQNLRNDEESVATNGTTIGTSSHSIDTVTHAPNLNTSTTAVPVEIDEDLISVFGLIPNLSQPNGLVSHPKQRSSVTKPASTTVLSETSNLLKTAVEDSLTESSNSSFAKEVQSVSETNSSNSITSQQKLEVVQKVNEENSTTTPIATTIVSTVGKVNTKPFSLTPDCEIDLMFIIDRSESTEKVWKRELQFAVDLVTQLSAAEVGRRVRVAAVSFNVAAVLEFGFEKFKEQEKIIDALLSIEHKGGSTSAVRGVKKAVKEIKLHARKTAKLVVVLISDGKSQDVWSEVVSAADILHETGADVYAVTVSHDYFFRELEVYAANKWRVYIDARVRQFLDDVNVSIQICDAPNNTATTPSSMADPSGAITTQSANLLELTTEMNTIFITSEPQTPSPCENDKVDLMLMIDTSNSVDDIFYAEKQFAVDLIKVLPNLDFENRISVALVLFAKDADLKFGFGDHRTRSDILYELERVMNTGGSNSIMAGVRTAIQEINTNRRPTARLLIVMITDGKSQDRWNDVVKSSRALHNISEEVYVVTLSKQHSLKELEAYAGMSSHLYADEKTHKFIQEVGSSVAKCQKEPSIQTTSAIHIDASVTKSKIETSSAKPTRLPKGKQNMRKLNRIRTGLEFARDEKPITKAKLDSSATKRRCKYSKMDLEIILDASASRHDVFEHQKELALSLIERLPISSSDTHVAVGINSFTQVPTLRQSLGLGRDKQMVRQVIEGIKYRGGSTLTAEAIHLSIEDLKRGHRPEAIPVVVLINDGMSQDEWDKVVATSKELNATGAERFGVALGEKIDLRELELYIGNNDRIYRDNSTERFLSDVVNLLTGGEDCGIPSVSVTPSKTTSSPVKPSCENPNLDILIVFDNSNETMDRPDTSVNANRYLLLDVLGSLPQPSQPDRIKISLVSFAAEPEIVVALNDNQSREEIFRKIEGIETKQSRPKYAKAITSAVKLFESAHRNNAQSLMLIVGDGKTSDSRLDTKMASQILKKSVLGSSVLAVDSGKSLNTPLLSSYTGTSKRVYGYDRNSEFAKAVLNTVTAANRGECVDLIDSLEINGSPKSPSIRNIKSQASRKDSRNNRKSRLKDISIFNNIDRIAFENDKVIDAVTKSSFTLKTTTSKPSKLRSTTVVISKRTRNEQKALTGKKGDITQSGTHSTRGGRRAEAVVKSTKRFSNGSTHTPAKTINRSNSSTSKAEPLRQHGTATTTTLKQTPRQISNSRNAVFPVPGCIIDAFLLIDASGSVEATFGREKELAASVLQRFRIGPNNTRVAIVKFATKAAVRTVWSFSDPQTSADILRALSSIEFSSGTTAIHSALRQAIKEYSSLRGARPNQATPIVIIFSDGFGQKDSTEASTLLRSLIPNVFAVAINHQYPINRPELVRITGDESRVFTDANIEDFYQLIGKITKGCSI